MRRAFAIATVCVTLLATSAAWAQESPSPEVVKLNEEGIAAFQSGDFATAAQKFHDAYELEPQDTLKKNEAVAWFKSGNCEKASVAAGEYLMMPGNDELSRAEASAVATTCDIQLAEAALAAGSLDEADRRVKAAAGREPTDEDKVKIANIEQQVAAKRKEIADAEAKAAADEKARAEAASRAAAEAEAQSNQSQTLGTILVGTGGGIILTGLVYHAVMAFGVAPKFRDAAEAGTDRDSYDSMGKKLETANWLVPTLYAVGAATAGVGVYFWMRGGESDSAAATAGREAGVTVTWRF